jgi:hypothetical protein
MDIIKMAQGNFKIEIDLNILNHLGIGLYSNTSAVLTEVVANAWDADAHEVSIKIDTTKDEITISDDGHGMNADDVQTKFLTVGYARRTHDEASTPEGRQCMGRKGIGKLAMFSLANEIHIFTRKLNHEQIGFIIDIKKLTEKIETNTSYGPEKITNFGVHTITKHGTTIVLKALNKRVNKTESFLRRRLARRFSVIGERYKFNVKLNEKLLKIEDRGFYPNIQLLWSFGDKKDETIDLCRNYVKHHHFDGKLSKSEFQINGFIGGVVKPEQLKREDDNNNTITLLANGRIFIEDLQKSIDDSKIFNSYLVGELQIDFFDANDQVDIAVSSRQGVNENDPRYEELIGYIKTRLAEIATQWTEWRRDIGSEHIEDDFPKVTEWLELLPKKHKKRAKQLIGKINTIRFDGTEVMQKEQKKEIIKHQILAFEKLRVQDNIEEISNINLELNTIEFTNILLSVEDIEASMQHDILDQRLAVIRKLNDYIEDEAKERVVQDHIYKHLWLIDPTWGHKPGTTEEEKTLTTYLKRACPDTTEGARFDIGYQTTAGRYIVIELKKPGLTVQFDKLYAQGHKYVNAMEQYFNDNPGTCPRVGEVPTIDIIFLVGKSPMGKGTKTNQERQVQQLEVINGKIFTYTDLVTRALRAYEEHLEVIKKVDRIRDITENL